MDVWSLYYYGGQPRLSLWWDNPNCAAAALVCILPVVWALDALGQRAILRVCWTNVIWKGIEVGIAAGVALTYSRGGTVAWASAIFLFAFVSLRGGVRPTTVAWDAGMRFLLCFLVTITSGTAGRFSAAVGGDASVTNRLELWRGGLQLIGSGPWNGWGRGASGIAFMNWIQNVDHSTQHGGMVNSYLHIAVEYGLPAFGVSIALAFVPILAGLSRGPKRDSINEGCAVGVSAFLVANVFSTLWNRWDLIVIPVCLVSVIGWRLRGRGAIFWLRAVCRSAVAAAVGAVAVYGIAAISVSADAWRVQRLAHGAIRISPRKPAEDARVIAMVVDYATLGPTYGREIRAAISDRSDVAGLDTYPPGVPLKDDGYDTVIVFGPRASEVLAGHGVSNIILVNPVNQPPECDVSGKRVTIIVPEHDEVGWLTCWIRYSLEHGAIVLHVRGVGQYIGHRRQTLKTIVHLANSRLSAEAYGRSGLE